MAEESSLESKIAELDKHVQDQSRFTRTVVVVCTAAIMGIQFWSMTEVFGALPDQLIARFMGNMDKLVALWNFTDASFRQNAAKSAGGSDSK